MNARLPWVLLAVSLALNLFFAGGVAYMKFTADSGWAAGSSFDAVVERVGLSDDRRAGLEALRERMQARRSAVRDEWRQGRKTLLAELAKPELDQARISELMSRGMARRAAVFEELLVEFHGYLATLPDEQRRAFLAMAEERGFMRRLFGRRRDKR